MIQLNLLGLDAHSTQDIVNYAVFLIGQWLFVLKRAGSAIRNPKSTITTRRQYVYHNWDTILIRGAIEAAAIFYPLAHFSIAQIAGFFALTVPAALGGSLSGVVGFFFAGFGSDSFLDWLVVSGKLPSFIANFIKENVPTLPPNGNGAVAPKE
jgi:hypothetical protein